MSIVYAETFSFNAISANTQRFLLHKADRTFMPGDVLTINETVFPDPHTLDAAEGAKTERKCRRVIGAVMNAGTGLVAGFVLLSVRPLTSAEKAGLA